MFGVDVRFGVTRFRIHGNTAFMVHGNTVITQHERQHECNAVGVCGVWGAAGLSFHLLLSKWLECVKIKLCVPKG
jgi:hypothetical protein